MEIELSAKDADQIIYDSNYFYYFRFATDLSDTLQFYITIYFAWVIISISVLLLTILVEVRTAWIISHTSNIVMDSIFKKTSVIRFSPNWVQIQI